MGIFAWLGLAAGIKDYAYTQSQPRFPVYDMTDASNYECSLTRKGWDYNSARNAKERCIMNGKFPPRIWQKQDFDSHPRERQLYDWYYQQNFVEGKRKIPENLSLGTREFDNFCYKVNKGAWSEEEKSRVQRLMAEISYMEQENMKREFILNGTFKGQTYVLKAAFQEAEICRKKEELQALKKEILQRK